MFRLKSEKFKQQMSTVSAPAGGGQFGEGGGAPGSVEAPPPAPPPVDQLMEEIAEARSPPPLEQRLHALGEADRKMDELLSVAAEVLAGLDKDKPLSKAKMEELYKKYELKLDEIQCGIAEQLNYMEQVCIGAEHQGSTFRAQQAAELSATRLQSLHAQLRAIRDDGTEWQQRRGKIAGGQTEEGQVLAEEGGEEQVEQPTSRPEGMEQQ